MRPLFSQQMVMKAWIWILTGELETAGWQLWMICEVMGIFFRSRYCRLQDAFARQDCPVADL